MYNNILFISTIAIFSNMVGHALYVLKTQVYSMIAKIGQSRKCLAGPTR